MSKEFYTVKEVADILGLSPDRIYENLRTGRLQGTQFTERGKWRIPDAAIQRLKGTSLGKSGVQPENKSASWSEYLDLAIQFRNILSSVGPKDWSICGLVDAVSSPRTSEAGLCLGIDQGRLVVKLSVESDKYFPLFLDKLKESFAKFEAYDQWRESLTDLVCRCWDMAHEIQIKAEAATGLSLSKYLATGGKGHLTATPRYIYEFALDNYASEKQPVLEILKNDPKHWIVVPGGLPNYMLAMGSEDEMEKCRKATVSLAAKYAKDKRIGEIVAKARQVKDETAPFQLALSTVIKKATGIS
jgi:excisionase family DNA binding protein